jgi:transposase
MAANVSSGAGKIIELMCEPVSDRAATRHLEPGRRSVRCNVSGNRSLLLGISKRGDRYLRTIMIHGARAALLRIDRKTDQRSRWAMRIKLTRGHNKAVVALANKNARIIWALLTRGENYRPPAISVASAGVGRISLTQLQA